MIFEHDSQQKTPMHRASAACCIKKTTGSAGGSKKL